LKLSEVNALCDIWRITKTVEGESFTTGNRVKVGDSVRASFKPLSTIAVDTTYGNTVEGSWQMQIENEGEIPRVGDVVEVKTACYANDPVRTLEGRFLDVMEVAADVKGCRMTLREARDV
jgi:hypothetical protein